MRRGGVAAAGGEGHRDSAAYLGLWRGKTIEARGGLVVMPVTGGMGFGRRGGKFECAVGGAKIWGGTTNKGRRVRERKKQMEGGEEGGGGV